MIRDELFLGIGFWLLVFSFPPLEGGQEVRELGVSSIMNYEL